MIEHIKGMKPTRTQFGEREIDLGITEVVHVNPSAPVNPWVDGNDLGRELDSWYEDGERIVEYAWRDSEMTVYVKEATNEIVGFGTLIE